MAKLVWRVRLVAELEPGAVTEIALIHIERDQRASLAELGLTLAKAKQLTAALQTQLVPAQVAALGVCRRACEACGRVLASKGHYGATFRSLFGDVPIRVERHLACPCQGADAAKSCTVLEFGKDALAPELAYVTAAVYGGRRVARSRRSCPSYCRSPGRSTPARCATGRCASARKSCRRRRTPPRPRASPWRRHRRQILSWSGWMAATCATDTGPRGAASR